MKKLNLELVTEKRSELVSLLSRRQAFPAMLEKIDDTVQYMVQNMEKRLPVSALAGAAKISPSHFFSLFKQRVGCSPLAYFIRLRMERACLLLDSTSARVKDVAEALGYDDAFYFSRVFKSCTTVAPSHYRNLGADLRLKIKKRLEPNNAKLLFPVEPVAISPGKTISVDDQQQPKILQGYNL